MKHEMLTTAAALALVALAEAATPEISNVGMEQDDVTRLVTITYTLANGPGVVTAEILTNAAVAAEGVSIGDRYVWNMEGAVNRVVEDGPHTITWQPDQSWPDQRIWNASVRARLTAWAMDMPPPYMVADLLTSSNVTYYASEEGLPGGLHENPVYKTSKIVLKRIDSAGVTYTTGTSAELGRTASREGQHDVAFTDNFYIGVFEVTRGQWAQFNAARSNGFDTESAYRPMANMSYTQVRWNSMTQEWGNEGTTYDYPKPPKVNSFLGQLRTKTGLDFDLPSEVQWEYAARGGYGEGYWGDGSPITSTTSDPNLDKLERYVHNGGYPSESYPDNLGNTATNTWTSANGTAVVGSYKPNGYGLYDMGGNVREFVLDFWANPNTSVHGEAMSTPGSSRLVITRGGCWHQDASSCRAAVRWECGGTSNEKSIDIGLRVCAPCAAK